MILDPLGILMGGSGDFNGFWEQQMLILMDFGICSGHCGGEGGGEQPRFVGNGIFLGIYE